jgi:hypothetical protein
MSGSEGATKGKDNKKDGGGGTANAAITEEDGVWSVFKPMDLIAAQSETESVSSWDYVVLSFKLDDDQGLMPDLLAVSDSDSESDGSNKSSEWLSDEESSEASTFEDGLLERLSAELADVFEDELSGKVESVAAVLTKIAPSAGPRIELYATQHLSPYHNQFTSYHDISP